MKREVVVLSVLCLLAGASFGEIYFSSGGNVVVDYLINDTVRVSNGTNIEVKDGGTITGYLRLFDTCQATISGGQVGMAQTYQNSSLDFSGGYITDDINTFQTTQATISGGHLGQQLVLYYDSRVYVTGGTFGNPITVGKDVGDAILTFYGTDFEINGVPVDYGQYGYSDYISGYLTGTLQSGDLISNTFEIREGSSIVLAPVPEPATLLLAAFGGLVLRKRKK